MKFPEKYRRAGNINKLGYFVIPFKGSRICAIAGDDEDGWEHVSVSLKNRCPIWDEMCFIKDLFWDKEDCVLQYHPPRSEYVNLHSYCLHLWKPKNRVVLTPGQEMMLNK